jgi:uncharacterized membrane protein
MPNKPAADTQVVSQQWSGPLPPPAALAQFEQLIPNGAERIMAMVEQEQAHRLITDREELSASIKDTRRGHFIGALIALAAIAASVYTASIGAHWSVSVALVGLPIAAIINSILKKS